VRVLLGAGLAGALTGTLVLGVGGRIVMRLAALIGGRAPGFSWGGSLEVIAAGALCGAAGGLLWVAVARRLGRAMTGPVLGAATFTGIGLVSDAARGAAASLPGPRRLTALVLFLLLCVAWGAATDIVARRWAVR
jgi:hypothetical protein